MSADEQRPITGGASFQDGIRLSLDAIEVPPGFERINRELTYSWRRGVPGAWISKDNAHRYLLWRILAQKEEHVIGFIGLNPSTADERDDDNTIRKETAFARRWGGTVLLKANLFTFRSRHPTHLLSAAATADGGADGDFAIQALAERAHVIVCAWGGPWQPKALQQMVNTRARSVVQRLRDMGKTLHQLALTKDGYPRHPLYLPGDSELKVFD